MVSSTSRRHGGAGGPFGGQAEGAGDQAGCQGLQPLDGVSRAAPGRTVGEGLRPRASPGRAERGGQRVDAEGEIVGERAEQRGLAGTRAAHAPRDRAQQLDAALGRGRLTEDMEAVADLHLLDFAEIAIELAECVVAAVRGPDAAILVEPGGRGKLQDACAQGRTAARIDRGGVEELVHQALQLLQRAVGARAGERRRQVVDDYGRAPPLGLAALAGVVHDERVDVGNGTQRGLWEAFGGKRERLARQPLHVAVLADVHHRVSVEGGAQPRVEGEIAVGRRQVGVVVALLGVDVVAPRRLDRDDDIAEAHGRQREAPCVGTEEGVSLRLAPAFADRRPHGLGERGEEARIIGERERALGRACRGVGGVGWACLEPGHQHGAVRRRGLQPIAGLG